MNRLGLHARAAAKLVHLSSTFEADVTLSSEGQEVDGKSILGVLLLAAAQGMTIQVRCSGHDENAALESILGLVAGCFGEDQ